MKWRFFGKKTDPEPAVNGKALRARQWEKPMRHQITKQIVDDERCECCGEPMRWHASVDYRSPEYYQPKPEHGSFCDQMMASAGFHSPQAGYGIGHYSCENGCGICISCDRLLRRDEECGCWRCACCRSANPWAATNRRGENCSVCGCAEGECWCDMTQRIVPGGAAP
jgi:hypothetical protein